MRFAQMFLILMIVFVLTLGALVGSALAASCPLSEHRHSRSQCGPNNCVGCGHYDSTCIDCEPDEKCLTSYIGDTCMGEYYSDYWGGANCEPCE